MVFGLHARLIGDVRANVLNNVLLRQYAPICAATWTLIRVSTD